MRSVLGTMVVIGLLATATLLAAWRILPRGENRVTGVRLEPEAVELTDRLYGENDLATAEYVLINEESEPVRLMRIDSSCSCLVAEPAAKALPVEIHAKGRRRIVLKGTPVAGSESSNSVQAVIRLERGGRPLPTLVATMRYCVEDAPKAFPNVINSGGADASNATRRRVAIVNRRGGLAWREWKVSVVGSDRIQATLVPPKPEEVDAAFPGSKVICFLDVTVAGGPEAASGVIHVADGRKRLLQVPVECTFGKGNPFRPEIVRFVGRPGQEFTQEVFVEAEERDAPPSAIEVLSHPDWTQVEVADFDARTRVIRVHAKLPARVMSEGSAPEPHIEARLPDASETVSIPVLVDLLPE